MRTADLEMLDFAIQILITLKFKIQQLDNWTDGLATLVS
jgi:hypothetical protein